jgi:hypothetical protein
MAQESQVSYKQSKPLSENDFERIQKLLAEMEERQEKISIVPLTKDSTRRKLSRSSGSSGVVNWADKVRAAITNLEAKNGRVLEPEQALALIDDIVEGKLAADELAMIHGIPQEWIRTTLGHITRSVGSGSGRSTPAAGMNSSAMSNPTTWHPVSPPPGRRRVACREPLAADRGGQPPNQQIGPSGTCMCEPPSDNARTAALWGWQAPDRDYPMSIDREDHAALVAQRSPCSNALPSTA